MTYYDGATTSGRGKTTFPGCETTSQTGGNVVNAGADDVSGRRSADGAQALERESMSGGSALPPGRRVARILPLFRVDVVATV